MTVIDKVKDHKYKNRIADFVTLVFHNRVNEQSLNIVEIEEDKRIIVESADQCRKYIIRTWISRPYRVDADGKVLSEAVSFTLFRVIPNGDGTSHGEEIYSGAIEVDII